MSLVMGLHHVTAISSSARGNVDFFSGLLGLRLVKRTVNFDDPGTWHLYFGDAQGTPGSALTFFPWEGVPRGRAGTGESGLTVFAAPRGSLPFWRSRLGQAGLATAERTVFGATQVVAADPDGFAFAIVEAADSDDRRGWTDGPAGADALLGFAGVELTLADICVTRELLTGLLGYREEGQESTLTRLVSARGAAATVDLRPEPDLPPARQGAGRVHHIAFRVADRAAEAALREELVAAGFDPTPPIDRNYFWSVYFRSPGGVLFEIATDEPGFTVDEPLASLGSALKLPPQYEPMRHAIERHLPPLAA